MDSLQDLLGNIKNEQRIFNRYLHNRIEKYVVQRSKECSHDWDYRRSRGEDYQTCSLCGLTINSDGTKYISDKVCGISVFVEL